MNTKLQAVADANGRLIGFFMSAGPVSDYTGAAALLSSLPRAGWLLADRGYDADWSRDTPPAPLSPPITIDLTWHVRFGAHSRRWP
jgi:hypothetical protein